MEQTPSPVSEHGTFSQTEDTELSDEAHKKYIESIEYSAEVRRHFLAPAMLESEKFLVYKSPGIPGTTAPHYVIGLDEYQGFKFHKDNLSAFLDIQQRGAERRLSRVKLLLKKRSKSHGGFSPMSNTGPLNQRSYTSYDSKPSEGSVWNRVEQFNLLPVKHSGPSNFNVLSTLEQDLGSDDSVDEVVDEEDEISEDLDESRRTQHSRNSQHSRHSRHSQHSHEQADDMVEDIPGDDEGNDHNSVFIDDEEDVEFFENLAFDENDFESSEDDYDPYGYNLGYPVSHKIPVIDIIVSDDEENFLNTTNFGF